MSDRASQTASAAGPQITKEEAKTILMTSPKKKHGSNVNFSSTTSPSQAASGSGSGVHPLSPVVDPVSGKVLIPKELKIHYNEQAFVPKKVQRHDMNRFMKPLNVHDSIRSHIMQQPGQFKRDMRRHF